MSFSKELIRSKKITATKRTSCLSRVCVIIGYTSCLSHTTITRTTKKSIQQPARISPNRKSNARRVSNKNFAHRSQEHQNVAVAQTLNNVYAHDRKQPKASEFEQQQKTNVHNNFEKRKTRNFLWKTIFSVFVICRKQNLKRKTNWKITKKYWKEIKKVLCTTTETYKFTLIIENYITK